MASNQFNHNNDGFIEVRDKSSGRLLFKYNPITNVIEMKKGGDIYLLIKLDEIRSKHGVIPSAPFQQPLGVEFVE